MGELDDRGYARIEQRNKFCKGDVIEIMKPDGRNIPTTVNAIYDEEGNEVESAPHPQQVLWLMRRVLRFVIKGFLVFTRCC